MTDRNNRDLAALLTPAPSHGVQFTQAKVLSWNNETLHNTLEWRGITITDVPLVEGINALVIREGDVVGMLGWAPENAKGVGSWWILGKLSNPGEFVADLEVTAKLFRFVTEDGNNLAFFGKEADGDPMWALYFGGSDNQAAIRLVNANEWVLNYRNGQSAIRMSGTEGNQIIRIPDQAGNDMFATNGATNGVGMADPWIPYHLGPTTSAQSSGTTYLPATASASFVVIYRGFNPTYHPVVGYGVNITATGTPEWRLRADSGSGLTTVASGSATSAGSFSVPNFGTTFDPGGVVEYTLEARNTGGGTTHIGFDRFYGRQS